MFTEISNCKFSCFHDSCLQRGKTKRFYISVSGFRTGCAETVISCADRNDLMSLIIHLFHGIKVVTYEVFTVMRISKFVFWVIRPPGLVGG